MSKRTVIRLDAGLAQDLDWQEPLNRAKEQKGAILWDLHLGLEDPLFPLDDELVYQGLSAALKHFSETVLPHFEKRTAGAILYRGSLDLSTQFCWSEKQKQNWVAWQTERSVQPTVHQCRLFCADSFASYFQMLAHRLPDELPLTLRFDASSLPRAEALHLLSKERFQHFELAVRGLNVPFWATDWEGSPPLIEPILGVCLPEEGFCTPEALEAFEALLQKIESMDCPFRIVSEGFMTEEWDGLDEMVVLSKFLSPRGKRKLMGFCAAGGLVATVGQLIGVTYEEEAEKFFEKVRGRGIRTPDLLVPNQPR